MDSRESLSLPSWTLLSVELVKALHFLNQSEDRKTKVLFVILLHWNWSLNSNTCYLKEKDRAVYQTIGKMIVSLLLIWALESFPFGSDCQEDKHKLGWGREA